MSAAPQIDWPAIARPVANDLLGEPNARLSSKTDLRFGSHGSRSLKLDTGEFYDHEAGDGGGVLWLIQRERRCDTAGAMAWLEGKGLIPPRQVLNGSPHHIDRTAPSGPVFYDYADEHGEVRYRVERVVQPNGERKFLQHGPDGKGGFRCIKYCMEGVARLPYRLPELIAAPIGETVFITEGEKDADRLASLGLIATTNSGGGGNWEPELTPYFAGRTCVVLQDNDDKGVKHVLAVCKALAGVSKAVVGLLLPGLPSKGDVSDWLDAGGDAETLMHLARAMLANPKTPSAANDTAEVSEDAIALAFTAQYRNTLRFDHDAGSWFEWDGTRWEQDLTSRAYHYARTIGRTLGDGKRAMCKASVASGAERFARADPAHAVTATYWDCNPMALGTPGGTVDLASGDFSDARAEQRITKLTGVTPEEGEPTRWLQFLREALCGDEEMVRYIQQWCGYCLCGETREHALAFVYGPGGNGKSVFLNTLTAILGDYAEVAAMETFTASRNDRHPTELAKLRGARLVTASETEEGRAWAESRIKSITGGDPVAARFMYKNFFTFQPQFKLTIAGNHAPQLQNVDEAMRRRFNIIPFVNQPATPDRHLEDTLRAEHGRILTWAIAGCRDWQANGLLRPQAVIDATTAYFDEQDLFGQWLAECCAVGAGEWDLPTTLFGNWRAYAKAAGDDPGKMRGFSGMLQRRGFPRKKVAGVRRYEGLRALEPARASCGEGG